MKLPKFSVTDVCPNCGAKFPLLISPRRLIWRELFGPGDLECSKCGQICTPVTHWKTALWSLPVTFSAIALAVYFLRPLVTISPALSVGSVIISAILILRIGVSQSVELVKIEDAPQANKMNKWIALGLLPTFFVLLGLITHRWISVLCGIVSFFLVHGIFFLLEKKEPKTE